jgi:transposase-like protein
MIRKNKYVNRSKISETKFRQLLKCFALDLDATQTALLTRLNRNTVNRYLMEIRVKIALWCRDASAVNNGEVEAGIYTGDWKGYDRLVNMGCKKHYRVEYEVDGLVCDKDHINGIESFCEYTKSRLAKFHGLSREHFYLHMKECEFRFNLRAYDIYKILLYIIRNNPLFQSRPNPKTLKCMKNHTL